MKKRFFTYLFVLLCLSFSGSSILLPDEKEAFAPNRTPYSFAYPHRDKGFFTKPTCWEDVRWDLRDDESTTARKIDLYNRAIVELQERNKPKKQVAPSATSAKVSAATHAQRVEKKTVIPADTQRALKMLDTLEMPESEKAEMRMRLLLDAARRSEEEAEEEEEANVLELAAAQSQADEVASSTPSAVEELEHLDIALYRVAFFHANYSNTFTFENYDRILAALRELGEHAGPWAQLKLMEVFIASVKRGATKLEKKEEHLIELQELSIIDREPLMAVNFLGYALMYEPLVHGAEEFLFYDFARNKAAEAIRTALYHDQLHMDRLFLLYIRSKTDITFHQIQFFLGLIMKQDPVKSQKALTDSSHSIVESILDDLLDEVVVTAETKLEGDEAQVASVLEKVVDRIVEEEATERKRSIREKNKALVFKPSLWLAGWARRTFSSNAEIQGKVLEIFESLADPKEYDDPEAQFEAAIMHLQLYRKLKPTDDARGSHGSQAFHNLKLAAKKHHAAAEEMLANVYAGTLLNGQYTDMHAAQKMRRRAALDGALSSAAEIVKEANSARATVREKVSSLRSAQRSKADPDGVIAADAYKTFQDVLSSKLFAKRVRTELLDRFDPKKALAKKELRLAMRALVYDVFNEAITDESAAQPLTTADEAVDAKAQEGGEQASEVPSALQIKQNDPEYAELALEAMEELYEKLLELCLSPLKQQLASHEGEGGDTRYPDKTVLKFSELAMTLYEEGDKTHMADAIRYLTRITQTWPNHGPNMQALTMLSIIYDKGMGVAKSELEAYKYLKRATQSGQIGTADDLARYKELHPKYGGRGATVKATERRVGKQKVSAASIVASDMH